MDVQSHLLYQKRLTVNSAWGLLNTNVIKLIIMKDRTKVYSTEEEDFDTHTTC